MPKIKLTCGDCLKKLKKLPDNSVDSVITGPPYGLSAPPDLKDVLEKWMSGEEYKHSGKGFMNAEWDSFVPGPRVWKEVLRVLKPGGTALVFAGTRTADLMGISMRLAGLQNKDTLMYLFGSGFPKNYDISKGMDKHFGAERKTRVNKRWADRYPNGPGGCNSGDGKAATINQLKRIHGNPLMTSDPATDEPHLWQGWGTATKPAFEPILVFQKPLDGTYVNNALKHGVAGLNIDGCKVEGKPKTTHKDGNKVTSEAESGHLKGKGLHGPTPGPTSRWPANIIHDGSEEVVELFPETGKVPAPYTQKSSVLGVYGPEAHHGDSGSAARFLHI